ncbi:hypothetical protein [Streptomyces sp. JHA26]|uniref:hypothetical protein n=1 Tax=Streptomyces sp. JHA26 TaxID=1917143 RepID=UPI00098A4514|nr:hypothetical protein [Streptomyces sp. JHA26]
MHRDRESEDALVAPVEPDETTVIATAEELIGQARESVDVCFAENSLRRRGVDGLLRALVDARGDAVRVRVLSARSAPGRDRFPEHLDHLAARACFDVRITRVPLADALFVDGRSALLIADTPIGPQASVTRGPGVVGALHTLFTAVWNGAAPAPGRIDWGEGARSEFVRRILDCLHAGMADELGARELSVSMRTYRRYVAEIMVALGANSRFQAGLRAAELGLLTRAGEAGVMPDGLRATGTAGDPPAGLAGSNGSFL